MMVRRRSGRQAPNWIITFADMVLILVVFFALMLSFSSMDRDRYRSMADAMNNAVNDALGGRLDPAALGQEGQHDVFSDTPAETPDYNELAGAEEPSTAEDVAEQERPEELTETYQALQEVLEEEVEEGRVQLDIEGGEIILRFEESPFFASGSELLSDKFKAVIADIIPVLTKSEGDIIVQGHTDDVPITTERFRSNWDLSTSRANSVVHELLSGPAILPIRVTAQGHADSKPLVDNIDDESRARNRRVEIHVRRTE